MTLGISCEILPEAPDALDQSLKQTATEHKGATVADEGKRYARNGHQPDGHGDVHEHMHREEHRHANGDQDAEPVPRGTSDAYAVEQHQPKQAQDREASQKTFFLGDNREDEIVVGDGAGQVTQLGLRALRPTLAAQAAAADRDERLREIVGHACTRGIDLFRGGEREDPVPLVVAERHDGVALLLEFAPVAGVAVAVGVHEPDVSGGVQGYQADNDEERAKRPDEKARG